VAFSPDGQTVLTGSWDKTARLWDAKTGQQKDSPLTHKDKVLSVAFSPDGQTVLTGCDDKTAHLWDVKTGQGKGPPLTHAGGVTSVAFSPDGQMVVTGSLDKNARLWVLVPPAADLPERLRLSVAVRTGFFLNAYGKRENLTQAQWLERQARLRQLGGYCDVRP
jgi:dipeptidyl aminopeptidase/acylaminoacyl peptidase